MFKQPAPEEAENAEHGHGHQQEKAGKTELQQEDALMAAVFEQIQLPQVRFVQSPTLPSPPNSSVPPNSVRSEMVEQTPRTPPAILEEVETENPTEAKSSKQLQPHQIQVGYQEAAEDEEEEPSLHLLSHRNSLERHWPMAGVEGELELEEEEDATPREGSLYTPSTVLDSHRSMAATAGETPGRADEEEVADEGVEEPAREASRASSGMSRELISSTVESALQNYSEAGGDTVFEAREENEEETEVEEEMAEEKEEQCIPVDEPKVEAEDPGPVRERSQFQLELDRRVGQRLSGSQSTSSGQSSPGSGSHPASRDIHVRTPLNDPSSPLVAKAYSAFEPEKQEMIRREIGSSGPERIRRLCGRFQAMGSGESQQPAAADEDEVAVEEVGGGDDGAKRMMPPMLHSRQRSAHFQLAEKEPKQQEEQPKRKNTPHPFRQQSGEAGEADQQGQAGVNGRSTEIVEESQRSVADILHQFQRNSYSHANGKKAAVANGGQQQTALSQHNLIGDTEERNGGISTKAGNGISIWANGKNSSAVGREPPPGSLAAIRKSLDSTPNTPTCPGPKILPPAPIESGLKSGQTSPGPLHGKGGVLPKNVSQFYHIWGSAQAQSAANGHGQRSIAHSPVGNGSTGDGH